MNTPSLSLEQRLRCAECDEVVEADAVESPLYECADDGMFTKATSKSDNHQCAECNKFGKKVADKGCPECNEGELEEVDGLVCDDHDEEIYENDADLVAHLVDDHELTAEAAAQAVEDAKSLVVQPTPSGEAEPDAEDELPEGETRPADAKAPKATTAETMAARERLGVPVARGTGKAYEKDPEKWWYELGFRHGKFGKPADKAAADGHPRYTKGYAGGQRIRELDKAAS